MCRMCSSQNKTKKSYPHFSDSYGSQDFWFIDSIFAETKWVPNKNMSLCGCCIYWCFCLFTGASSFFSYMGRRGTSHREHQQAYQDFFQEHRESYRESYSYRSRQQDFWDVPPSFQRSHRNPQPAEARRWLKQVMHIMELQLVCDVERFNIVLPVITLDCFMNQHWVWGNLVLKWNQNPSLHKKAEWNCCNICGKCIACIYDA